MIRVTREHMPTEIKEDDIKPNVMIWWFWYSEN